MREFKVIEIIKNQKSFQVEIEFKDNAKRRKFLFSFNNGWEDKVGEQFKFMLHISKKIELEEKIVEPDLLKINKEIQGKIFKKPIHGGKNGK